MTMTGEEHATIHTRASLRRDVEALGIREGNAVMIHSSMSKVGRLLFGPDALVGALLDAVGASGTVLAYTDWEGDYEDLLDDQGRVRDEWREHVPPFDPNASRATRDNGVLPEFIRTTPGARRSANPGASVAALGGRSDWFTADHPLDYGYGEGSPLAKLVEAEGKVLMVGAPLDTMTLLHHAEHLAAIPGKRLVRHETPFTTPEGVLWRTLEEFDTSRPVVCGLAEDFFGEIVGEYLATGRGCRGLVGDAASVLVEAAEVCRFGVDWLESRVR
jgi:aminoglycoside 3-N-acetyltransferase